MESTVIAGLLIVLIVGIAYIFFRGKETVPLPAYERFEDKNDKPHETDMTNDLLKGLGGSGDIKQVMENLQTLVKAETESKKDVSGETMGNNMKEGFFGGAAHLAPGAPDCARMSAEGSQLIGMFQGASQTETGSDDFRELTVLVGKLSCFKKDLVSPAHIVDMTRKQEFVTAHDIEPIGETTGRCFAKTISPRDLQIAFDKWMGRGSDLIRRLCTSYGFKTADYDKAMSLFQTFMRDINDIARGSCLAGEPSIAGKPSPRDPRGYSSNTNIQLGAYSGYY
jgi:hypothetical protein